MKVTTKIAILITDLGLLAQLEPIFAFFQLFLSQYLFAVMEILHKFDIGNIVTIYKVMNYNTGKTKKSDFKGTGKQGDSKMVARG